MEIFFYYYLKIFSKNLNFQKDIVAIVKQVNDVEIKQKRNKDKFSKELQYRELVLIDQSNLSVRCVLWENNVNLKLKKNLVIQKIYYIFLYS
jgi:hypothetical protein